MVQKSLLYATPIIANTNNSQNPVSVLDHREQ